MLTTDELGKDLASVQNLMKKHQLVEADIIAHEDRISDMNEQADSLVESGQFDSADIRDKRDGITKRLVRSRILFCVVAILFIAMYISIL